MRITSVVLLLLFSVWPATAQETGSLAGRVASDDGMALFGANVAVAGDAIEGVRGTTSDGEGAFRIDGLPPGVYEVTASFLGYASSTTAGVMIRAGQTTTLDLGLAATTLIGEQVVVSASRKQEKLLDAPASISVVELDEIMNRPALSVTDYIKDLSGVDQAKVGVSQSSTVIRGFNRTFTGSLLQMVDNRIARIASLRLNMGNAIPLTNEDIQRIEVVRGPGSALYGPNSANGVMHIVTRSPIGSEGNAFSLFGGERSLRKATFRHASSVDGKMGFKVSGEYSKAREWAYEDALEVIPRDDDNERLLGEIRIDLRPTDDLSIIGSAGYSRIKAVQMTGQGAAQAVDWSTRFFQARSQYKGWFAQVFVNMNDAGDTKLLRTTQPIVDTSRLTVMQLQHNLALGTRQQFTYGADVLLTRPNTGNTTHGQFEDRDNLDEYGLYLQSETTLNDQVSLMLAGRVDEHSKNEDPVFSPRAALVFKPSPESTLRLTYNRAFGTPSSVHYFLDLIAGSDPFGLGANFAALGLGPDRTIDLRTQGVNSQFTFRRGDNGLPMYRSPFAPVAGLPADTYLPMNDPASTNLLWGVARGAVLAQLTPQLQGLAVPIITQYLISLGLPAPNAAQLAAQQAAGLAAAFPGVIPSALPGLTNALGVLDTGTGTFNPVDPASVRDVDPMRPSITETFEVGYKGVVGNKLVLTADFYRNKIHDFISSIHIVTPNVFLDLGPLASALGAGIAQQLALPENAQLAGALAVLDDPATGVGGDGNGSPVDELTRIFVSTAAAIPYGTVTPEEATDPNAVMLTYRNFGEVSYYGTDLGFSYYPNDIWSLSGSYSFINENLFEKVDGIDDIPLNAPKHKLSLALGLKPSGLPLNLGARMRYRGAFEMADGVYVGDVESHTVVDVSASYDFSKVTFSVEASNLLDKQYQAFVGAPMIGRLVMAGLAVRF
ncbi:MAG: TonB-dependent receptor [Gemmatimonadetes bacterium]|nr:TonB-dependent receptor [Gemmatimonadota bacterium]MYG17428.1 TonB-dependent receptor [Gemmatimonadota bacterium]